MNYTIRNMTRDELDITIEWAAKEGWNPGLYDANSFFATDPKGFFMGFLDDKPIASLSAVSYDAAFGFLGFYIVKKEFRNKGYGFQLWNEALKHLPTQNIGLDGVVAQQENYQKSGFALAYRNIRYEGRGLEKTISDPHIFSLSEIPFEKLLEYDSHIFPTYRDVFLKEWVKQSESTALAMVQNEKCTGYGMIRKCRTGYKIGPLFADNEEVAEALFVSLCSNVSTDLPVFFDVPEINKEAVVLAYKFKMKPMFETARMYTKKPPKVPINKVFGVTTFELG